MMRKFASAQNGCSRRDIDAALAAAGQMTGTTFEYQ